MASYTLEGTGKAPGGTGIPQSSGAVADQDGRRRYHPHRRRRGVYRRSQDAADQGRAARPRCGHRQGQAHQHHDQGRARQDRHHRRHLRLDACQGRTGRYRQRPSSTAKTSRSSGIATRAKAPGSRRRSRPHSTTTTARKSALICRISSKARFRYRRRVQRPGRQDGSGGHLRQSVEGVDVDCRHQLDTQGDAQDQCQV